jgi:hypothetical protein
VFERTVGPSGGQAVWRLSVRGKGGRADGPPDGWSCERALEWSVGQSDGRAVRRSGGWASGGGGQSSRPSDG